MPRKLKTIFSNYERPLYIGSLSCSLGKDIHHIKDLSFFQENQTLLKFLSDMGLQHYRSSELSPAQQALESAKKTIALSERQAPEIDAVIYVSESFWSYEWYSKDHNWLLEQLGLENAYMIGTFLRGCSNIHSALRIAANLCNTGEAQHVLIITTDKARDDVNRLVPPNIGITSDGAASLILSTDSKNADFRVLCNAQTAIPSMHSLDESAQYMKFLKCVSDGVTEVTNACANALKLTVSDFHSVVTNNYSNSVLNLFGSIISLPESKFITENISQYGHCYSSDNIINLLSLLASNRVSSGELVFNLSSGPAAWGGSVLQKV